MGLEQAILILSAIMAVATAYAWRWARRLQAKLSGHVGYDLARLLAWIIGASLIARLTGTVAVAVLDRENLDTALQLSLIAQLFSAIIFVGAAFEVWRISRKFDDDTDSSGPESPGQLGEGVRVEVDEVGSGSTVAIDDLNRHAMAW